MKNRKLKLVMAFLAIMFIGFQFNLLFQISASAASNYSPSNSDYAMSVAVDLSNISIYEISNGNTTTANITSFNTYGNLGSQLLMYLPDAQILSGSSPQAVLFTYNHLNDMAMKALFTKSPVITSYSPQGYSQINTLLENNHYYGPMAKIYSISKTNSLATIEQFSSTMAQRFSIMNVKAMNANFTQSSFNNQIGQQGTQSLKFTAANVNMANVTAYDNMSANTYQGNIDPAYYSLYQQFNSTVGNGTVSTSEFNPNMQTAQTQQTFFAGYTNFEDQAIQTPVKDYAIQALASQGIYLSASQLMVNYTSINDVNHNMQISGALRDHILAPYNKTLASRLGLFNIHYSFLGFNFFNIQSTSALFGFTLPNLNASSIINSTADALGGIATSAVNIVGAGDANLINSAINVATSGASSLKSLAIDTGGTAFNAMLHAPQIGSSLLGAAGNAASTALSGVTSWSGKLFGGAAHALSSLGAPIANLAKSFTPGGMVGSILSTGMSFIKPYIPYILLGIGIIAVAVLTYFLLPRIITGIIFRKH